ILSGTYDSDPDQDNAINYGIRASAIGGNTTYGGRFAATGGSNKNYGIYVTVSSPQSGTTPPSGPNYAGYFAGDVYISGTFGPSDIMLKDNVNDIDNASNIINQLNPKTFDYKQADFPNMNLSSGLQYGLIAQEVETILPDLITNVTQPAELDSLGNIISAEINFKGLEYQQLIPILIAGFKEQQQVISSLQSTLEDFKNCLNNANICTEGNKTINQELNNEVNQRSIELTNHSSIILDQNLPNPFAENTVINYNIPTDVMEAKLMFYDLNGRIIKELIIEERGESKLTVYGENLKTGIYTYSLIADGELIATKKMVKK
ncbi:MAG TPA: tail fiber domain-containing protein, partial [Vicingus sp.]|nr:tail fiber domain-containing protein [Vicingus sp.]